MSKTKAITEKKKEAAPKGGARYSIHNLHNEYLSYIRAFDFYKEEIKYLQKRLAEITKKNTAQEIMAQVEQFQNQFILLREVIDVVGRDVKVAQRAVEKEINKKPTHTDEKSMSTLNPHSTKFHSFEKDFAGIRLKFNKFLAKYM